MLYYVKQTWLKTFKYCYKKIPSYSYMENKDGFWCGHMQIENAPFMTLYLEKVGLHIQQLFALQLYLTPFMPIMHDSSKEPSKNKTPNFVLEKLKDLQRKKIIKFF